MYSSKNALPLAFGLVRSSKASKKTKRSASKAYPDGLTILKNVATISWSLFYGAILFLYTSWKENPRIQQLPWFRLLVLAIVAFILFQPTPADPNPSSKAIMGWVFNETEESATKKPAVVVSKSQKPVQPVVENTSVAPAEPEKLKKTDVHEFIARFSKTAKEEMELFGIPASIKLGQAILESQSGNSILARESKNFFGIKCKSKCKSCTCRNYKDDDPYDMFRVFETPWESWREHSKLLGKQRYSKLPGYGMDYKKWAKGLKAAGYATDPKYDKKLISVIEKYNLTKFDR